MDTGSDNKDKLCNYPLCNCPFDMGRIMKCSKGRERHENGNYSDGRGNIPWREKDD